MALNANPSNKRYYPNTTPMIHKFATNGQISAPGVAHTYNVVTVYGDNFYPNDVTKIDLIGPNKTYAGLEYVYYTNKTISFIVPGEAFQGSYQIQVKNVDYRSLVPYYLYSNKIDYLVTH